ncbi:hypothetical protein C2G38_2045890 [Gigaspora rosea]|uniref:Uncharacterized protein n=1 Tax=Gigaspora rosea TaxID=44941 RepID=A0A397UEH7_9GLOM|nr:hypothetical protein C2G38_2045890 [Gigaspora rosea]
MIKLHRKTTKKNHPKDLNLPTKRPTEITHRVYPPKNDEEKPPKDDKETKTYHLKTTNYPLKNDEKLPKDLKTHLKTAPTTTPGALCVGSEILDQIRQNALEAWSA